MKKNNAKILQASTSEVYSDPEIHTQTEDYNGIVNPIRIRSCYYEEKKLTINGVGTQTHSFEYIDDLINAMIEMMNSNDDFIGPVNIGKPQINFAKKYLNWSPKYELKKGLLNTINYFENLQKNETR